MAKDVNWLEHQLELENQMSEYADEVKRYLRNSGGDFINKWSEACERNSGRISYNEMGTILGKNYPKAKWIPADDKKEQIIAFFKQVKYPFRYDEKHLYFP